MAKEKSEGVLELTFPAQGLSENLAYKDQPPLTTPIMANMRLRSVFENRAGGGQREGMVKAFTTQIAVDKPVLKIVVVTNTFLPAG